MANVIIYKDSNAREMTPGRVVTLGENGQFDTVTERWYYGAENNIISSHLAGTDKGPEGLTGGNWVCIGLSDIERLPGGAIIATVTWRGLRDATGGVSTSETRGIREANYDAFTGIPGTTGQVNARILEQTVGLSVRAISRLKGNYKPAVITQTDGKLPGGISAPTPPKNFTIFSQEPLHTYPYGWVCYSWQEEEAVPGFYLVSAEFRYEHKLTWG